MKPVPKFVLLISLSCAIPPCIASQTPLKDPICAPLKAFVSSVKPGESRTLQFHTSWGQGFKDTQDQSAIYAKRCIDHDYKPARAACVALMAYGAIEFAGINVARTLTCLSQDTQFGPNMRLNAVDVSLRHGSDDRGSDVTIHYGKDRRLGGMVLTITTDGY